MTTLGIRYYLPQFSSVLVGESDELLAQVPQFLPMLGNFVARLYRLFEPPVNNLSKWIWTSILVNKSLLNSGYGHSRITIKEWVTLSIPMSTDL